MKITAIKQQVKRLDRFSIFVDDKYSFSLGESELIASGVHTGQELTKGELDKFKERSKLDKIYGLALNLVARRPRSEKELRDYLRRKKHDEDNSASIINKLKDHKLLDDNDFAHRWVENRRLLKPISKRRLIQELRQKGISSETIDQVLAEDETTDRETLKDLIERKRRQTKYRDDTKLMQYLARQGYSYDDIKSVMNSED
ncbi:MAG TPA: regulatory protein RecX [Candidatus Saccharimonadales bacterium]|nr:regulatory protein RecX [Candidatus Saccharimonadales bacterium]